MEGDSLLLLEEPELSLHSSIVRELPGLMWRIMSKKKRQVIISTHSPDILADQSIGAEDIFLLTPGKEGTRVQAAASQTDIMRLIQSGIPISEVVIPQTQPPLLQSFSRRICHRTPGCQ